MTSSIKSKSHTRCLGEDFDSPVFTLLFWAAILACVSMSSLSQAAITVRLPDIDIAPGDSGTLDASIEIGGPSSIPGIPFHHSIQGYDVTVLLTPDSAGLRLPSVADGFFGVGISTQQQNSVRSTNGIGCTTGFGVDCPPSFSTGTYLLLSIDYHIGPDVEPGTRYDLSFDRSATEIYCASGPCIIDAFVDGTVTVGPSSANVRGGPVGLEEFRGAIISEDFEAGSPGPIELPLETPIARFNSGDLRYYKLGSDFGLAIGGGNEISAELNEQTKEVGAWISARTSGKEVTGHFYSKGLLLGSATVHTLWDQPTFLGFRSSTDDITKVVFEGDSSGVVYTLDGFTASLTVPEPDAFLLLLAATGMLFFCRRKLATPAFSTGMGF